MVNLARRLAFLNDFSAFYAGCMSIGDVRQTDDARERVVLELYDNFR